MLDVNHFLLVGATKMLHWRWAGRVSDLLPHGQLLLLSFTGWVVLVYAGLLQHSISGHSRKYSWYNVPLFHASDALHCSISTLTASLFCSERLAPQKLEFDILRCQFTAYGQNTVYFIAPSSLK